MATTQGTGTTRSSIVVAAPPATVYEAFTNPDALVQWLVPGDMTGKIHRFDHRVGGGYEMSLFYPDTEQTMHGKSDDREDRYAAHFVELTPPSHIVEVIIFDSDDPAFSGEMTMDISLEPTSDGTRVTIDTLNIPSGIRPEDNEAGTRSSLEKLARYVTGDLGFRS